MAFASTPNNRLERRRSQKSYIPAQNLPYRVNISTFPLLTVMTAIAGLDNSRNQTYNRRPPVERHYRDDSLVDSTHHFDDERPRISRVVSSNLSVILLLIIALRSYGSLTQFPRLLLPSAHSADARVQRPTALSTVLLYSL